MYATSSGKNLRFGKDTVANLLLLPEKLRSQVSPTVGKSFGNYDLEKTVRLDRGNLSCVSPTPATHSGWTSLRFEGGRYSL